MTQARPQPELDFSYYTDFFHDGSVNAIVHIGDAANILMNSAELLPEENRDRIALDQQGRLNGMLLIRGIQSITVNDEPCLGTLSMNSLSGALLDLDFDCGLVELGTLWQHYPRLRTISDFTYVIIKADQILWEDGPNNVTIDLTNLNTKRPHTS